MEVNFLSLIIKNLFKQMWNNYIKKITHSFLIKQFNNLASLYLIFFFYKYHNIFIILIIIMILINYLKIILLDITSKLILQ